MNSLYLAASVPVMDSGITSEMMQTFSNAVSADFSEIIPVAIGIFTVLVGAAVVPKIIKKFTR